MESDVMTPHTSVILNVLSVPTTETGMDEEAERKQKETELTFYSSTSRLLCSGRSNCAITTLGNII